jgi:AraC family transcriptional regulator of arabinose operon
MEFFPLGLIPDQSGVLLHEAGFLARNDWWNFPNTFSPFWRLYYNGRSGHKVVFPNAEYELTPEHIVLIPDRQLFHSVGLRPVPHLWMAFQVGRLLDARQSSPILLRPTPIERQLLDELARQFTGIGEGPRDQILHLSLALLHLMLRRPEIKWQAEAPMPAVARAFSQIDAQVAEPLRTSDLARVAGMSVRRFTKAFKRQHGVTAHQLHIQSRVRKAAHLLANTEETLETIAEMTGFPNRHYLSRVFKRLTGDSPARFRHKQTNEPEPG